MPIVVGLNYSRKKILKNYSKTYRLRQNDIILNKIEIKNDILFIFLVFCFS
jgi:hypothetical protein